MSEITASDTHSGETVPFDGDMSTDTSVRSGLFNLSSSANAMAALPPMLWPRRLSPEWSKPFFRRNWAISAAIAS